MNGSVSRLALRVMLVAAALAATVILTGFFSDTVRYACLGVVVLVALLSVAERRRPGGGWWAILATGAALSLLGALLSEASDALGGLVAVVGGALVVIGATVGFPAGD